MAARPQPGPQSAPTAADRFLFRMQAAWQDLNECTEAISSVSATLPAPLGQPGSPLATRDWYEVMVLVQGIPRSHRGRVRNP
jgi:hypothetical protein